MKILAAFCCLVVLTSTFTGCGKNTAQAVDQPTQVAIMTSEVAEPLKALDEIYQDIDVKDINYATEEILQDKFFIDSSYLEEYYVRYTSGRFGVSNVFILKPAEDKKPQVRESLEQIKISCAKEYENYDIYNSYQISQNAVIFEQGDYLVMLMLADNDAARQIINKYMPKE